MTSSLLSVFMVSMMKSSPTSKALGLVSVRTWSTDLLQSEREREVVQDRVVVDGDGDDVVVL